MFPVCYITTNSQVMFQSKIHTLALAIVALTIAGFLYLGLQILTAPKIFLLARPLFAYEAPVLVSLAVILAWFREWAARKLVWLFMEIHRLVSTLVMAAVIGAEGLMHFFSIPHAEGWWIPLLGGGVAATANAWLQRWRKKQPNSQEHLSPSPSEAS